MARIVWSCIILLTAFHSGAWGQERAGTARSADPPRLDKNALESYARYLYMWGPRIRIRVYDPEPSALPALYKVRVVGATDYTQEEHVFYVAPDGRRAFQGPVYDLAGDPFEAERTVLAAGRYPSYGPVNAPVHVVVFFDFQCEACGEHSRALRGELRHDYPNEVRVTARELPLVELHDWAKTASIAGRCVYQEREDAYWLFYDWIFGRQSTTSAGNIQSALHEFWTLNGLNRERMESCMQSPAAARAVDDSVAAAHALSVNGTPSTFVNGRRLRDGASWRELKRAIDFALQRSKAGPNADCNCTVEGRAAEPK